MFIKIKNLIRKGRIKIVHLIATKHASELEIAPKSIIIAPHPDDEVIGCSGLIQQLLKEKKEVFIIFLTGGGASHNGCSHSPLEVIKARRVLAETINKLLGVASTNVYFLEYPDGRVTFDHPETNKLNQLIKGIQPQNIFVPHLGEGWNDHIQARNITLKLTEHESSINLYEYCVWFWYYNVWDIDWKNAQLLSLSPEEQQIKSRAINCYIQPKAPCGKPWSGNLPKVFIEANRWNKELYFRIK